LPEGTEPAVAKPSAPAPFPGERRVVFFLQGINVPAARVRGFTIAGALASQGIRCELRIPTPSVYGDTSLLSRWRWARWLRGPLQLVAAAGRPLQLRGLRRDDVVFLQRPMVELPTTLLERIATRRRCSIFDFDDAIFLNVGGRRKLRQIVGMVDQVIAGNQHLAEQADAAGKTTVIPTIVDTDRFRLLPTRDRRGADVVFGWTGLASNYPQLLTVRQALSETLRHTGARLLLISNAPPPPELATLRVEYRPWRPETELEDLAEIDVGLMPLPDTPYARGKCAYKLIQYMALGRPGVASPVGANREVVTPGIDGFLPNTDGDWQEALIALAFDPDLRCRVGEAARRRIETAYSLTAVLPRYLEILRRLGSA
jgi:glycosyltransferase involved in cell wall biosynthesis